jgi:hypothetical protein
LLLLFGKGRRCGKERPARGVAQDAPFFTAARLERRAGALTETLIRLNLSLVVLAIPGLKNETWGTRRDDLNKSDFGSIVYPYRPIRKLFRAGQVSQSRPGAPGNMKLDDGGRRTFALESFGVQPK